MCKISKSSQIIYLIALLTTAAPAYSAYTVIDDDLQPTNTVAVERGTPMYYAIPFNKKQSSISSNAKTILDGLLYQMQSASIRITGRPDADSRTADGAPLIAVDRATNIRSYLVAQGIPTNNITIDIESTATTRANGSISTIDLYIVRPLTQSTTQPRTTRASAQKQQNPQWTYETINVPFCGIKTSLGPAGKNSINNLSQRLTNARDIIIQGRPNYSADMKLAYARSDVLRQILVNNGANPAYIKLDPQATYQRSEHGPGCGYSNIRYKVPQTRYVGNDTENDLTDEDLADIPPPPLRLSPAAPAVAREPALTDMLPIDIVRRAFVLGEFARFNQAQTLKLLEEVHRVRQHSIDQTDEQIMINYIIQQTTAQSTQNAQTNGINQLNINPKNNAYGIVAVPATNRIENWKLDKNLTLRDNLDAWSRQAGWRPTVWDASNYYQTTVTSTLQGGFPDVLRQIADSTGLNICAKKREKYVRVTDSTVSCKD